MPSGQGRQARLPFLARRAMTEPSSIKATRSNKFLRKGNCPLVLPLWVLMGVFFAIQEKRYANA